MLTLYGIPNCDTCRKARRWLEERGIAHRFHDLRRDGLGAAMLRTWADALGWERLLNRQSSTWRQLPEADRTVADREAAIALLARHPTLLKRPLLARDGAYQLGFRPADYEAFCS